MKDRSICPRCNGEMVGGICEECGFPITTKKVLASYFEREDSVIEQTNDVIWAAKI